jgi:hypothetical protein
LARVDPDSGCFAAGLSKFFSSFRTAIISSVSICPAFILAVAVASVFAQVVGAQFGNARLERLRGLKFKRPVPVVALKPEEAQQTFEQDLAHDFTDERLSIDGTAGSMVGLFPPQFDLKKEILKQAMTQFGGIYSDHQKKILLIVHGAGGLATLDMSWIASYSNFFGNRLAHEVTHALQDQHFDLESMQEKLKDEDDRSTAFASVFEGDATLAAVAYTGDALDNTIANRLVSNLDGWSTRSTAWADDHDVPEGLSAPDLFAHLQGIRFVAEVYRRGGWPAVNSLYSHPPVSTQQVLNPQLYFDHRLPLKIELAGYQKVMPAAVVVHTDTYGELLVRVILRRNLAVDSPEVALADRWAGDRMAILKQGNSVTVVWMLAFSDLSSAQQFAAYYSSIVDRLDGSFAHRVDYRGNQVLCIIGDGLRQHPELPAETWKLTAVSAGNAP